MNTKKLLSIALAAVMATGVMAGCTSKPSTEVNADDTKATSASDKKDSKKSKDGVALSVVTSFGGDDGNRANYEKVISNYEKATGNTVKDNSGTATEDWKVKVMTDFEVGAEPDVLFYFNGADANTLVSGNKVVSLETIQAEYPDYASNMKAELLGASPLDGKNYSIPVNGYWEALYVNENVLDAAGVTLPDKNYKWEQFLKDCEAVKGAGLTPIAASLFEVPNYWFEFTAYNYNKPSEFNTMPKTSDDVNGKAWVSGLNDIKTLFDAGYFPKNTNTATDSETYNMFLQDQAAFLVDGSWKVGDILEKHATPDKIHVTYFPSNGTSRQTTDLIAGLSMGYYITEKAWSDPAKKEAAVKFVMEATSDETVKSFCSSGSTNALKATLPDPVDAKPLQKEVIALINGNTGLSGAVEDLMDAKTVRDTFMKSIQKICTGDANSEDVVKQAIVDQEAFLAANK